VNSTSASAPFPDLTIINNVNSGGARMLLHLPLECAHVSKRSPGSRRSSKRKHVGDVTPNPLPEHDYSVRQPSGDDSEANPGESSPADAS
jgi:hypothetical protein